MSYIKKTFYIIIIGIALFSGKSVFASTEFISTIRTAENNGDYTMLSSWESAVETDLTADTTKVFSHGGITGAIVDGDVVTGATSGVIGSVLHATTDQVLVENIRTALTGTLTFTNASTAVSGSSTIFSTELSAGDYIWLDADQTWAEVSSITDDSNLVLSATYPGTGGSGTASLKGGGIFQSGENLEVDASNYITIFNAGDGAIAVAECYNDWENGLEDYISISGWETNATNYVKLYTPERERHTGKAKDENGDFTGFALSSGNSLIYVGELYTQIDGLILDSEATQERGGIRTTYYDEGTVISNNIILRTGTSNSGTAITGYYTSDDEFKPKIYNNIIYSTNGKWSTGIFVRNAQVYNNVLYNNQVGYRMNYVGNFESINNIALNNTDYDFEEYDASHTFNEDSDHNISSDSTAPGSNSQTNISLADLDFISTTSGSEDLHIGYDSVAKDAGTDLSATFTTDIDGQVRNIDSQGWDIGADETSPDFISKIRIATESDSDFDTLSGWEDAIESDLTATTSMLFTASDLGTYDSATDNLDTLVFTGGGTGTLIDINSAGVAYITGVSGTVETGTVTMDTSADTFTISNTGEQIGRAVAECYNDWPSGLDDNLSINGWVVGVDNYVKVYTPETERHNGTRGSGFRLNQTTTSYSCVTAGKYYTVLDGLEINGIDAGAWNAVGISSSNLNYVTISNNLVYDFDSSSQTGITVGTQNDSSKVFNNIVINNGNGFYMTPSYSHTQEAVYNNTAYGGGNGFYVNGGEYNKSKIRNNIAIDNDVDFFAVNFTDSDYNISSDDTAPGDNSQTNISLTDLDFTSTTFGSEDLHIGQDSVAKDAGTDLSATFTTDIDGETRGVDGYWDIGADEAPTQIFRSVGPSATSALADDNSHANTITLSGGEATFSVGLADNIGVGDVVIIDTAGTDQAIDSADTLLFVSGRTSSTVYTLQTESGGLPADIAVNDTYEIYRAHTSLFNAEAGTENSTLTTLGFSFSGGDRDLVTNNEQWNIACYANGTTADTTATTIDGWTTGELNYIKIYTPYEMDEVGGSQRHGGVWDDEKYNLVSPIDNTAINLGDDYVRIDGLQISISSSDSTQSLGVWGHFITDSRISNNIIRGTDTVGRKIGIQAEFDADNQLSYIWNNIVYGMIDVNNYADVGIRVYNSRNVEASVYIYNNTVYDCYDGIENYGSSEVIIKNNIVQNCTDGFSGFLGTASDYNISDIVSDAPNDTWTAGDSALEVKFVNEDNDDFRLYEDDIVAKNQGTDLSSDSNLAFDTDIQGHKRGTFDIGADEASEYFTSRIRIGTESDSDYTTLSGWEAGNEVDLTAYNTLVFTYSAYDGAIPDGSLMIGETSGATATTTHVTDVDAENKILLYGIDGDFISGEKVYISGGETSANFVTLSDIGSPAIAVAECYNDWASGLEDHITVDGWTTGATNYVKIYVPEGERHDGTRGSGFFINSDNYYSVKTITPYTKFIGLEIRTTYGGPVIYGSNTALSVHQIVDSCLLITSGGYGYHSVEDYSKIVNSTFIGSGSGYGIHVGYGDLGVEFYNNTVMGFEYGIDGSGYAVTMANNISIDNTAADYTDTASVSGNSDYNIASDSTAPGSNSQINVSLADLDFLSTTIGSEDLHISQDSVAKNTGTDLSSIFTTDIDGETRGVDGYWDIGADEAPTQIFRSVGASATAVITDDNSHANTITLTDGESTFSTALADNIGVGDVVLIDADADDDIDSNDTLLFVSGRTSSTVYTLQTESGGISADIAENDTYQIYRAYTSLSNAEAGTENSALTTLGFSFTGGDRDLVANNEQWNIACYGGVVDTTAVTINGWTLDEIHYIEMYTPYEMDEVGESQRHSGTWDDEKYVLNVNSGSLIQIGQSYIRINGLQLEGNGSGGYNHYGVYTDITTGDKTGNVFVENNIIQGLRSALSTYRLTGAKMYYANNIIYDCEDGYSAMSLSVAGGYSVTYYVHNNAILNSGIGFNQADGNAIAIVKNNITQNCTDGFSGTFDSSSDYNISDIASDAPNDTWTTGDSALEVEFVDEDNDDFHLALSDVVAKNAGTDLSSDENFAFATDIDGQTRDLNGLGWDIGADEASTQIFRSVGPSATSAITDDDSHANTITLTDGEATFSTAPADNIGVGDVVLIDTDVDDDIDSNDTLLFISGRTSSTVYTLQTESGGFPTDITVNDTYEIYRAYTSLSDAEAGTENSTLSTLGFSLTGGDRDLVANNEQWNIACYANGTTADSTNVVIDGWTTGELNSLKIYAPYEEGEVGESQRHDGVWDDEKYNLSVSSSDYSLDITNNDIFLYIDSLQIENSSSGSYSKPINSSDTDYSTFYISNNLLNCNPGDTATVGGGLNFTGYNYTTEYVWNNIIYFSGTGLSSEGGLSNDFHHKIYVYNNTVSGFEYNYYLTNTPVVKNNISRNSTNGYHANSSVFDAASDYNISDIVSDAPNTTWTTGDLALEVEFVDAENQDFHLDEDDTVARNQGTDLSSDSNLAFDTGIQGHKRGTFDIGADEASEYFISRIRIGTESDSDYTTLSGWESANQVDLTARNTLVFTYSAYDGTIPDGSSMIGETSGATATVTHVTDVDAENQLLLYDIEGDFQSGETVYIEGGSSAINYVVLSDIGSPAIAVAECYNDWASGLADKVKIDGWATSATNYVKIYTPESERHNGILGSDGAYTGFTLEDNSVYLNAMIEILEAYSIVDGIAINHANGNTVYRFFSIVNENGIVVSNNLLANHTGGYACVDLGGPAKVYNNIIYNSSNAGIHINQRGGQEVYNNTITGCEYGITESTAYANYSVVNNLCYDNNTADFSGFNSSSAIIENNLSSDGTADDFTGTGNQVNQTVQFLDYDSDDFHLSSTDVAARNKGTDLSDDAVYAFSTDIDGDERGVGSWDIGADETSAEIFRSVGPGNVTTLQNGSGNNLTISGSTATFASAVADNIGIGDAIQYDSTDDGSVDSIAFIHRRISSTQFTIKKNTGETPTVTTSADQDWDIFRAYTSLANAESGIENTGILEALRNFDDWTSGGDATTDDVGVDLAAENQRWNIACYKDAVDSANVAISGWTTNDVSVLKIFAPSRANEVGTSQKHTGIKDTGYKLQTAGGYGISISTGTIIRGLEIENTLSGTDQGEILISGGDYSFVTIRDNIIHGGISGIATTDTFSTKLEIYNNFIFNAIAGIRFDETGTVPTAFIYNNTIADCTSGILQNAEYITPVIRNTIITGSSDVDFDINTEKVNIYTSISSDGTADDFAGSGNFASQTVSFQDDEADDFHLLVSDTVARENGADLSTDADVSFWLDIDGEARAYGTAWDIGADESVDTNTTIRGGVNIRGGVEIKN